MSNERGYTMRAEGRFTKCEIDVDEIDHTLNFGYKKGVWNNAK